MARRFEVALPDGSTATRRSETRCYEFVVVARADLRARAARLRRDADVAQEASRLADEIVQSGDLSRFARERLSRSVANGWTYSSYVPGFQGVGWLPDWQSEQGWARYAPKALADMRARPGELRDAAAGLEAGPPQAYEVVRWSSTRALAERACAEFAHLPETTLTVQPCQTD